MVFKEDNIKKNFFFILIDSDFNGKKLQKFERK